MKSRKNKQESDTEMEVDSDQNIEDDDKINNPLSTLLVNSLKNKYKYIRL